VQNTLRRQCNHQREDEQTNDAIHGAHITLIRNSAG
jgi:hypothetical protein